MCQQPRNVIPYTAWENELMGTATHSVFLKCAAHARHVRQIFKMTIELVCHDWIIKVLIYICTFMHLPRLDICAVPNFTQEKSQLEYLLDRMSRKLQKGFATTESLYSIVHVRLNWTCHLIVAISFCSKEPRCAAKTTTDRNLVRMQPI